MRLSSVWNIILFSVCFCFAEPCFPALFTVDNTADSDNLLTYTLADGTNSLRKCIRLANSTAGLDTIWFNIPSAPFLITCGTALPVISDPVLIDGFSQAGAAPGTPVIAIDGTANVLELDAGSDGSTISGLIVYGATKGIYVNASNGNTITGNYIGTDATGNAAAPALITQYGIHIFNSSNTIIGGPGGLSDRNIISGCQQSGIRIDGTSTGTVISGNYVGVNQAGTAFPGNQSNGIYCSAGADNTVIGGNSAAYGNVISGNKTTGLVINASLNCIVRNNFIGTDYTGNAALGNLNDGMDCIGCTNVQIRDNVVCSNSQHGIYLSASNYALLTGNKVGIGADGITPLGNIAIAGSSFYAVDITGSFKATVGGLLASDRNIISSNNSFGLTLFSSDSAIVKGNYIGTDVTGMLDRGNKYNGIEVNSSNYAIIGGSSLSEGNLLSGNDQYGINVVSAVNTLIQSNFVGTDYTGNATIPNTGYGIILTASAPYAQILNNVSCGNAMGILVASSSDHCTIKGNKVGIGADGVTLLGNSEYGIDISSVFKPQIGGANTTDRNIISGNPWGGIAIDNADSAIVQGNYIGTDASGMLGRGNGMGMYCTRSNDLLIGGGNVGEGNIISGNNSAGIYVGGVPNARASIKGNIVGLAADLSTAIPNKGAGVYLGVCANSLVGGTSPGERNYISSNSSYGINLDESPFTVISGNYIGTDGTGLLGRGNASSGINVTDSRQVLVGGTGSSARNIIAATSNGAGISVSGNSQLTTIKGNFVGIGVDGSTDLGNWGAGMSLLADSITIGDSTFMERNVSSCNGKSGSGNGVTIQGSHTFVYGNYLGVDSSGTVCKPNVGAGIYIWFSDSSTIGGSNTYAGNICSCNMNEGIYIQSSNFNKVYGNFIGTDKTGSLQLGNEKLGINLSPGFSSDNVIGGSTANANIIAYNENNSGGNGAGVFVAGSSNRDLITYNKIYCNAGKGIQITSGNNESVAAPVIISSTANNISGTGTAGDAIHIYLNTKKGAWCDCEGEVFVGTTTVTGAGTWAFNHNLGLTTTEANAVTATQTTPLNSTSEFSACIPLPLPVSLLYFEATKMESYVALNWATSEEHNNLEFVIQKSSDGLNFDSIGTVIGNGNTNVTSIYSFEDHTIASGTSYYRLMQVDRNGTIEYSQIRSISDISEGITLYVTPDRELFIKTFLPANAEINLTALNVLGQLCYQQNLEAEKGYYVYETSLKELPTGLYVIKVYAGTQNLVKKIILD